MFLDTFAKVMPSGGATMKFHIFVAHFVGDVQQLGGPDNWSGQEYEKAHKIEHRLYTVCA
jgi:hypothetical protein